MDLARGTLDHAKWHYQDRMNPSAEGFVLLAVLVAVMLGGLWFARRRRNRRHPIRRRQPNED